MELLGIIQTLTLYIEQLSNVLATWGYLGVFLATFIASSFIPFPSSVIYVLALTESNLNPIVCILCATVGNTCGSLILFSIGRLGKLRWLCTYGRIKPLKVRHFVKKAQKWGPPLAFLAFFPGFGQTVVVALGLLRCDAMKTTLFIMLGKLVRYIVFVLLALGVISSFH